MDKYEHKKKDTHKTTQEPKPAVKAEEPKAPAKTMPLISFSKTETKLLQDIASHLRQIKSARYASVMPLDYWLRQHNYPPDYIDAAMNVL